jgi:hypothetical protein
VDVDAVQEQLDLPERLRRGVRHVVARTHASHSTTPVWYDCWCRKSAASHASSPPSDSLSYA